MMPALYVLCSTADSQATWLSRASFHCDLDVVPVYPVHSAVEKIHELAAEAQRPFLVCRDYIWVGLGMARQVECLLAELNGRFPNWAICGNRGIRWDGHLIDFTRDIEVLGVRTSLCVHPVISIDDNLLLINPVALRGHREWAPSIESMQSGVLLSLECLANGSAMAVSPRLMVLRGENEAFDNDQALEIDADFGLYYRSRFLNHHFPTPAGGLNLTNVVDLTYLSHPGARITQENVLDLYDRGMEAAPCKPSLTICCRTQFKRSEMLERAVLSFSACREHSSLLGELRIQMVTDQPEAAAEPVRQRLERIYPAAKIGCWFHTVRERRLSRIDLLIEAIRRAETDYIWFIDDDDYVNPKVFSSLARCLMPDCPMVVIASSPVVEEKWEEVRGSAGESSQRLMQTERSRKYFARRIFEVLKGDNHIPICGMIFPVRLLRERLRNRAALGEYAEDYFLLLLALTAPRVEVCVLDIDLATVSSRGEENTTSQRDRSVWNQSYATFLLEILNNPEGNSPFLWQQANASAWEWME